MIRGLRFTIMALAAGLIFGQQTPPAPPSGTTPPGTGGWATGQAMRIGVALKLTDDQRAKVQTALENQATQLQPLTSQLRQNRDAIQKLAKSDTTGAAFETQLTGLAGTQGSLISKIAVIRAKSVSQIWGILTPEQRSEALQMPALLDPSPEGRAVDRPRSRLMRPGRPMRAQ